MYLSKLELIGFKSFAHRTVLRFNDGITAIVGPNGCGKSNLIDALRWAIGEQKASVLRSDKMENVIFNGAGKRRPLGMAEVALTIENTKGILPTEYSEVTIARRLFRNGDSEYLLNKVQCRLRDIVDLFMDTGMGANAYSVIELKMIETILSDRADERRRLFEEAAGVTKYKHRRREALRRLDQTQGDLTRVNDIVKEVSKKVASLERQAQRAKEFTELDAERRTLEVELLEREYAATMSRLGPLREKLKDAQHRKDDLDRQLAQEEAVIQELEREHGDIDIALLEAQKDVTAVSARISQLERERAVAQERRRSLMTASERAERDIVEAQGGLEALAHDKTDVTEALERLRSQITETEGDLHVVGGGVSEMEESVANVRRRARSAQESVIAVINRLGDLRGEEERTRARIENLRDRLDGFDEEDAEAIIERQRAGELLEVCSRELEVASAALERAQQEFTDGEGRRTALRAQIDKLQTQAQDVRSAIAARDSKIEFLAGLVDQDESVRFLFERPEWSPVEPVTVGDAVTVSDEYRVAVSAALGAAAHFLIVASLENARRGIAALTHASKGKATFVCLDRVPQQPIAERLGNLKSVGWASDLTSSAPQYDQLRRYLLGDTVIVADIDDATDAVARGVDQAVTLDGIVVRRGGIVRGGGAAGGAIVGKREQIERLGAEVGEYRNALASLESEIGQLNREHDAIDVGQLSAVIREAQRVVGTIERSRSQFEYDIQAADDLIASHEVDRVQCESEIEALEGALAGIDPRREELRREHAEGEQHVANVSVELDELEREFAERTRRRNEIQVLLASLKGDERSARAELERIRRDREKAEKMIENRQSEKEEWAAELDGVDTLLGESAEKVDTFRRDLVVAQQNLDEIVLKQAAKREEIHLHSERLREERKGYESALGATHDLEMKISELTMRAEAMVERGRSELDFELTLRSFEDQGEDVLLGDLREQLRSVKGRLKMLGTVNLLAYEEWNTENERLTFLRGQVDDLRAAEKSLIETIEEINDTAQRIFMETFEAIRTNFQDIFSSLFLEGDEADVRIGEGDPLEAQIEIIAKPRGKRPHSIDLLSGGEKTLTAIALLFAIYLVKPSPFCILDEVDAPLDDANIDRFITLVRRFVRETQFIIVTHNKRTMAAADTMYGVTQEEDGVSKIVSVRFTESGQTNGAAARQVEEAVP